MKGNYVAALAVSFVVLGTGACGKRGQQDARPERSLVEIVRPTFLAQSLVGGAGHYHATLRYTVGRTGAAPLAITTTTDVWRDPTGNYRLREQNDHDGGREVVLHGRELSVALRYGKMIRRVAEEPEPSRLLEEGVGGPWAMFELCAPRVVALKTQQFLDGTRFRSYDLTPGDGSMVGKPLLPLSGLRAWRGTVAIDNLTGHATVLDGTDELLSLSLVAKFHAKGENGPEEGTVELHAQTSDEKGWADIERPAAEELSLRQRTVPEAHELLRGLAAPEHHAEGAAHERQQVTGSAGKK